MRYGIKIKTILLAFVVVLALQLPIGKHTATNAQRLARLFVWRLR